MIVFTIGKLFNNYRFINVHASNCLVDLSRNRGVYYAILWHNNAGFRNSNFKKSFLVKKNNFMTREGFAIVALSWLLISLLGAIPFCLTGEIPSYVDAVFETVIGFYNNRIFDFIQCGGIKPYKFILAKLYTLGWRNGDSCVCNRIYPDCFRTFITYFTS